MAEDPNGYDCEVLIIGAGPAGCSAAAVLAEHGRRVIVLERRRMPRYRIGESLIPYCWFPLDRIGMVEKLKRSHFTNKYSVQFVGLDGRVSAPFFFSRHTDHDCANTWQVVRSEFDQMLVDNAREKGAEFRIGVAAKDLLRDGEGRVVGVVAQDTDSDEPHELRAPITIDASGRDMFAVGRNNWRVPDPKLRKIAIWTYYKGAKLPQEGDPGTTTVAYVPQKGWFWYIPLPEDVVSVGVVADREYLYREGKGDPDAILNREIEIQPWIKEHLDGSEKMAPCKVTGDYSYRSKYCADDGLVLIGDAFAFLDPVFSSGVFLALQSGVMAGDAAHEALAAGDYSAERFAEYGRRLCKGIEAMRRLVYAFYDEGFHFGQMLRKYPHLRRDLTDCLIGNLERDFDDLFSAIGEFAEVPEPLPHGGPRTDPELEVQS